jgi:hypothetical protein
MSNCCKGVVTKNMNRKDKIILTSACLIMFALFLGFMGYLATLGCVS